VLIWLSEWAAEKQHRATIPPGYCAIVLGVDQAAADVIPDFEFLDMFKEDFTPLLGGNIFVGDYALNRVHRLKAGCRDLSEVVAELKARGLSDLSFVAFDVETQAAYAYEGGTGARSTRIVIRPQIADPFDEGVFQNILDEIYTDSLRYPADCPSLWHDRERRVPCKETEVHVQGFVCAILRARAQGNGKTTNKWLTIHEKKNNAGRVDIAIFQGTDGCKLASEVKVLRARHFTPDATKAKAVSEEFNKGWAIRGARQAQRYKDTECAPSAVLVLYDMRQTDGEIPEVVTECRTRNVKYLRYYLHNALPDAKSKNSST
jgi:hypothetical protein